jgi:hypothetical protein
LPSSGAFPAGGWNHCQQQGQEGCFSAAEKWFSGVRKVQVKAEKKAEKKGEKA